MALTPTIKSLVVNPNHDIRRITARLLQELGAKVTELPTPTVAYTILAVANPFDIIFIEIDTPVDEGLEFLQKVKTRHPHACIVATSSLNEPDLKLKAAQAGAIYCIFERHSRTVYRTVLDAFADFRSQRQNGVDGEGL